jgi:hypothetical protein
MATRNWLSLLLNIESCPIELQEALRYYEMFINEHVARFADRPADHPLEVTLEMVLARRDADRAAGVEAPPAQTDEVNKNSDDSEDEEEAAAEMEAGTAVMLAFLAALELETASEEAVREALADIAVANEFEENARGLFNLMADVMEAAEHEAGQEQEQPRMDRTG